MTYELKELYHVDPIPKFYINGSLSHYKIGLLTKKHR